MIHTELRNTHEYIDFHKKQNMSSYICISASMNCSSPAFISSFETRSRDFHKLLSLLPRIQHLRKESPLAVLPLNRGPKWLHKECRETGLQM